MRPDLSAVFLLAALQGGMTQASPTPPVPAVLVHLCYENSDVAPWRFRNRTGLNFLMLETVARESRVRFVYHARPWRRCQDDLRTGRVDGAFGMSSPPRNGPASPSTPGTFTRIRHGACSKAATCWCAVPEPE